MKFLKEKLAYLQHVYRESIGQDFQAKIIPIGYGDERTFSVHYLAKGVRFLVGFRTNEFGYSNFIHIIDVFILDPRDRGQGWGSKLFSSFLQVAEQSNYDKILLSPKDELAEKFWAKWGFIRKKQKNLPMELELRSRKKLYM